MVLRCRGGEVGRDEARYEIIAPNAYEVLLLDWNCRVPTPLGKTSAGKPWEWRWHRGVGRAPAQER